MVDFREVIEEEFKNEHRMNVEHSMRCLAESGCNVALLYFKGWDVEYHAILPFDEDIILSGRSGSCGDIEEFIFGTKGDVHWIECYYDNNTFDTEDIELRYGDEPMPNSILVTGVSYCNVFFQCIVTVVDPEYRKKKQLLKEAQEKESTPYVCKDDDILNHL